MKLKRHVFRVDPVAGRWAFGLGLGLVVAALVATHAAAQNSGAAGSAQAARLTPASLATAAGRDAFVSQYCLACHNAKAKVAGLVLEGQTSDHPGRNSDLWEKVARRLVAGEMPPPTAPRKPDLALARAFGASLMAELDAAAAKTPYTGPSLVRRLNRAEYGNAVRDIFGINFIYGADLPVDNEANGFDNIADALSMSPVLLESYLKVGRKVTDLAIGITDPTPSTDRIAPTASQSRWVEGAPFGTRGGVAVPMVVPRSGEYEVRAVLNTIALAAIDGQRLFRARLPLTPGPHKIVVAFPINDGVRMGPVPNTAGTGGDPLGGPVDIRGSAIRPTIAFYADGKLAKTMEIGGATAGEAAFGVPPGPPTLVRLEITGPYNAGPVIASESRNRVFVCRPAKATDEQPCAQKILYRIGRQAFRREVSAADMKPYLVTYKRTRAGGSFDAAVAAGIRDILIAPDFLFRLELDPQNAKPGSIRTLNDYELATRLSFFLWSSIPDDRLLDAAKAGKLHTKAGLEAEIGRMLADRKSDALVDNFAAQWLGLKGLVSASPDPMVFPEFDESLRTAFGEETSLFMRSVVRENRSIKDVVGGKYTFINEQLAKVYDIPGVSGSAFRRVQLSDNSPRGGVLAQGSILMGTSHPNKTSPILRGKWVLDNLLNSPPPPPPNGVPALDTSPGSGGRALTVRQQIERHRASAFCSGCHARMDPYGFALENFDGVGKSRTEDEGGLIDATARLPNGQTLSGIEGLRSTLLNDPTRFVNATVARLMTYALGRPLGGMDQPAVRQIVKKTAAKDYRFGDIIMGVVETPQFRTRETSNP